MDAVTMALRTTTVFAFPNKVLPSVPLTLPTPTGPLTVHLRNLYHLTDRAISLNLDSDDSHRRQVTFYVGDDHLQPPKPSIAASGSSAGHHQVRLIDGVARLVATPEGRTHLCDAASTWEREAIALQTELSGAHHRALALLWAAEHQLNPRLHAPLLTMATTWTGTTDDLTRALTVALRD